ncbi:MAG: aminomethyl transferase family protein, partial [Alphaproteobacteria bacterium]
AHAANSMRLEKGYRAWGSDLTTERSPLEAGLARFVRNREHPRWQAVSDRANDWEMVLIEILSDTAHPFHAHGLWQAGRCVGMVSSAAFGHRCGKSLALAWLRDRAARSGLELDILGRRVPARILDRPPFDPDDLRLRHGGEPI